MASTKDNQRMPKVVVALQNEHQEFQLLEAQGSAVELVAAVLAGKPTSDLRVRSRSYPSEEELVRRVRPER
jgi:hypothetical protein